MERIALADFLAIAAAITDVPVDTLERTPRTIEQAQGAPAVQWSGFGEHEAYPGLAAKAAAYAASIVRYHPLVDGNKRAARVTMRVFLILNGATWTPRAGDSPESEAEMVQRLAAGELTWEEWAAWVSERIA